MATNIKQFLTGIGLVPQSSDPTSPVEGQIQFSDGTVRASGLWQYKDSNWAAIGGGGGGLDIFVSEDFSSSNAASFSSGNNATFLGSGSVVGTLADEEASPLAGTRSIKLTQASGSLNDYISSAAITLDTKQKGNTVGVSFYYTYDGADEDVVFVAYDNTNNAVLTDSLDVLDAASIATRFSTSFFIPATCASISYGFQVKSETIGAILVFDDIEISTNPFVSKQLVDPTSTTVATGGSQGSDGTVTNYSSVSSEDLNGYTITSGVATFTKDMWVVISGTGTATGIGHRLAVTYNAAIVKEAYSAGSGPVEVTHTQRVADGDTLSLYVNSNPGYVSIRMDIMAFGGTTEHIVTPAKSNMTDWVAYTPTSQGFGTLSGTDLIYRRDGPDLLIQGTFGTGTISASEAQISLPTGLTVKSGRPLSVAGVYFHGTSSNTKGGSLLYTGGDSFLNFGAQGIFGGDTTPALTPQDGSTIISNATISVEARIPIQDWSSDVTFLAAVPVQKIAFLKDVKAAATDGGTFTSGAWQTRDLNTVEGDSEIVSLSANQFTLQAGKYVIEASAPVLSVNAHIAKLKNITDNSDEAIGEACYTSSADVSTNKSSILAIVEISSAKTFEIQHQCQTTKATNGLGVGSVFGVSSVFTQVKITKLK